jgi:hypothetical protein
MTLEQELIAQGWTRQTVTNEPRLSEVVELYRSLGFEVRLEPIEPSAGNDQGCDACFQGAADAFRVVYTRPGPDADQDDDPS